MLVWVAGKGGRAPLQPRAGEKNGARESELTFPCLILLAGFAGSQLEPAAFARDTLPKQVSLLAG